jgi:hypothetical protein
MIEPVEYAAGAEKRRLLSQFMDSPEAPFRIVEACIYPITHDKPFNRYILNPPHS